MCACRFYFDYFYFRRTSREQRMRSALWRLRYARGPLLRAKAGNATAAEPHSTWTQGSLREERRMWRITRSEKHKQKLKSKKNFFFLLKFYSDFDPFWSCSRLLRRVLKRAFLISRVALGRCVYRSKSNVTLSAGFQISTILLLSTFFSLECTAPASVYLKTCSTLFRRFGDLFFHRDKFSSKLFSAKKLVLIAK